MIINKTLVSFAGRAPSPRYVPVGVVGDNLVECIEFRLPTIDADQTATMMLKCKYADAVALTRTDTGTYCADITAQIAGESGRLEAYIRIDGAGGAVWNSEPFMLCVCNVPDVSGDIEDREPGALERTLSAIAAHNATMKQHGEDMEEATESASESAENAAESAERAEAAAERAENAGGTPGKTAYQYAQDGGYTGTEAEFAAKLAQELPGPYTLPVATADTLGGVKVGGDFVMDGETLKVKPESKYELIEKIAVGYRLLTEKPDDWDTNWSAYCENTNLENAVVALSGVRAWEPYKYYADNGEATARGVTRTQSPDGTPYRFSSIVVKMRFEKGHDGCAVSVRADGTTASDSQTATINSALSGSRVQWAATIIEIRNGYSTVISTNVQSYYYGMTTLASSAVPRFVQKLDAIMSVQILTVADTPMPKGCVFEIWGARAK